MLTDDERRRFLDSLSEDEAFRNEVRRQLLTEELLSLPGAFTRLVGVVAQLAVEMHEGFAAVDKRLNTVEADIAELKADVRQLKGDVSVLKGDVSVLKSDMSQVKGGHYETRWRENAPAYLGSRGYRRVVLVAKPELAEILDDALDDGRLSDPSLREDILLLDSVHRGRRADDNREVQIATEVSSRVHLDDVDRARRRASALSAISGDSVVACVVGASIDERAEQAAEAAQVMVVLPSGWSRREPAN